MRAPRWNTSWLALPLLALAGAAPVRLDFGTADVAPGWTRASDESYADERGFGWVGSPALRVEHQSRPDPLRSDFVAGSERATFRLRVTPGLYRLAVVVGDMRAGHAFGLSAGAVAFPPVETRASQYLTVTAAFAVAGRTLDVTLDPRGASGWVLNGLSLEPAGAVEPPRVVRDFVDPGQPTVPDWLDIARRPDPTAALLARFRHDAPAAPPGSPVDRLAYLKFIESDVDFWAKRQDGDGAIIDPYLKAEWQYSTPCFAFAAAELAEGLGRADLVEPAARALDWATVRLSQHKAATGHEDFYPPWIALAMDALKPRVPAARYDRWAATLRSYSPFGGYEMAMGSMNWNVVALAGESMFHDLGLRDGTEFVEDSLAAQNHLWASDWGVYGEGPIPYDAWPRLFLMLMRSHGYRGPYRDAIAETLRRGALTGLFMQSPAGEMPVGARSSQHVWNEALQCALFEAAAGAATDPALAGAYKRAAGLSLSAMTRWKRATGELQVVHNWVDPQQRFGYEIYTAASQYNLMACAVLAAAYQRAGDAEAVAPTAAPADVGGFVLDLRGPFHKVIANAGGTYAEVDTGGDGHYSPTGLLRVHQSGVLPTVGPSDGLVEGGTVVYPDGAARTTAAVGLAWQTTGGAWRRLAEVPGESIQVALTVEAQTPQRVAFALRYTGDLGGPTAVVERYVLTPGRVEQASSIEGYAGPLRVLVPVLSNDGREAPRVSVGPDGIAVQMGASRQRFAVAGASAVVLEPQQYAFRNGWAQLGRFDVPAGRNAATLVMTPTAK